ncbi:MAG: four-carbon acid sugar kinase family protein [Brachyspira sp.]|nr:four-carbon acid sugar kinase family protein [Brachyspira sp.]
MIFNSNVVGIVADDLTGANDTALQFQLKGANTQILLDEDNAPVNLKTTQTWAISTESRNIDPQSAYEKAKSAAAFLKENINPDFYYKKIDSTVRGNIAVEVLAMLDVLDYDAVVLIPAFPQEGRVTVGGYHLLKGIPIERTEMARDPHSPIFESHLPILLRSQLGDENKDLIGSIELTTVMKGAGPILMKLKELISEGKKIIVMDSVSTVDIEQIVLAIGKSEYKILPAGTAAAAQVLSGIWLPDVSPQHFSKTFPELPKLVISGSATQITSNQITRLEEADDFENILVIHLDMKTILDGVMDELVERITSNLGSNNIVVVHTSDLIRDFDGFSEFSLNAELTKSGLANVITDFLAELTRRVVSQKDVILITLGGETSYKCCEAIGANQLQLIDEVAPAIALSMDHSARWIVTKSGNLGGVNTLVDILKYFENHE